MNELLEIEKITQLKARYFRALDTNDWELFGSTLAENCVARYSGGKYAFECGETMGEGHLVMTNMFTD